jgi:5-deoxy-glucuronate isomerase
VNPPDGFGIARYYNPEEEFYYTIRNNTLLMMPKGYHTLVSAPGYTTYYLWFLGGDQRVQAVRDDPTLSWVGRTVPMLRELGH